MLEKCGSLAVLVSFRTTRPFDVSATKMSTDSSERAGDEGEPAPVRAERRPDVELGAERLALHDRVAPFELAASRP